MSEQQECTHSSWQNVDVDFYPSFEEHAILQECSYCRERWYKVISEEDFYEYDDEKT